MAQIHIDFPFMSMSKIYDKPLHMANYSETFPTWPDYPLTLLVLMKRPNYYAETNELRWPTESDVVLHHVFHAPIT